MSSTLTEYVPFIVYDYTGNSVLSSYDLSITPFTFIPFLPTGYSDLIINWDFGDGSVCTSLTAEHYYKYPGVYDVKLFVTNCVNQTKYSSYTTSVSVFEYFPNTIQISTSSGNCLTAYNGQFTEGLILYQQVNKNFENVDIFYNVLSSNTQNYFSLSSFKYNHLLLYHCLYTKDYNSVLGSYEYNEIDKIAITGSPIFVKLDNTNTIVHCLSTEANSVFIGHSGTETVYYRDDLSGNVNLNMFFDKTQVYTRLFADQYGVTNYHNVAQMVVPITITVNPNVNYFSITSTGLDGEGSVLSSFNLTPYKFKKTKIPFVIKVKDTEYYSVKNFPTLSSVSIGLRTATQSLPATFSYTNNLNALSSGGYILGEFEYDDVTTLAISGCYLSAYGNITNFDSVSYTISGVSTTFTIYPHNYYQIYKINEDYDMANVFKTLRFQEFLLDDTVLFDDYIKSIFGDANSDYNALGKKLYERITNIVDNNQFVDTAEIDALQSMAEMLYAYNNQYSQPNLNCPSEIKRLINILSVRNARLFGQANQFTQNFDPKGYSTKTEYGKNLGNQLNTATYIITAGTDIVALEKFSNTYNLLNTRQPLSSSPTLSSLCFPLSTYDTTWGWPLILPPDYEYHDLDNFYVFFEYNSQIDGTLFNNIIDFNNSLTTVLSTYNRQKYFAENDIFEILIADTLYNSLSLYSA